MKRETRTALIHVRVTKRERELLEARAETLGYASLSEYIRTAARWLVEQKVAQAVKRAI
jgi:Arc/MetJ-type ribon-helix-helix transcriptional regulator